MLHLTVPPSPVMPHMIISKPMSKTMRLSPTPPTHIHLITTPTPILPIPLIRPILHMPILPMVPTITRMETTLATTLIIIIPIITTTTTPTATILDITMNIILLLRSVCVKPHPQLVRLDRQIQQQQQIPQQQQIQQQ